MAQFIAVFETSQGTKEKSFTKSRGVDPARVFQAARDQLSSTNGRLTKIDADDGRSSATIWQDGKWIKNDTYRRLFGSS